MRSSLVALIVALGTGAAGAHANAPATERADPDRWRAQSARVMITRDNWGIAHVRGQSDADAVFGAIYAQAEDDISRIERNYAASLGRLAVADGRQAIYSDLRARLFADPERLPALYAGSPAWLQRLMAAWADGLNYFLWLHPAVRPKVITHYEPWMALAFTEGSIGGDIETIDLTALERLYGGRGVARGPRAPVSARATGAPDSNPGGSNGFAIAPRLSATGHALLWINPHTSFYFRSELQMTSGDGLDAYGAATWGQFFIYQGFNRHNGWMHTSYGGDAIDEYAETLIRKPDGLYYAYGTGKRKLSSRRITIEFREGSVRKTKHFIVYASHHGPIVRAERDRWIAVKLLEDPVPALSQSFLRTKTTDYDSFRRIQDMRTDTSNNTVYADSDGTIAYFHGNFIPRRDPRFDFTHPVDGSDPATEWQPPHALEDTITLLNPPNGWILNTNNWPFSAAGPASPRRGDYPPYMWTRGENPRGLHAAHLLEHIHDVTLDSLIAAAYDPHLTAFDVLLPPLIAAYDALPADDPRRRDLAGPVEALRSWDGNGAADSVATAVAIYWAQELADRQGAAARAAEEPVYDYLTEHVSDEDRVTALHRAVAHIARDFGRWATPWGEINRFQRITDDIVQPFDDDRPSLPVGFAPAQWGALASFDSTKPRHTRKIYGSVGNSFVAAVEFGPVIHAKAIMSGGASGDPASPHFSDQSAMFAAGSFRDVLFLPDDVSAHTERRYHPGE